MTSVLNAPYESFLILLLCIGPWCVGWVALWVMYFRWMWKI